MIQILNPKGTPPPISLIPMAPRLDNLDDKTIYIVDVNFQFTEPFYVAAEKLLAERFPSVTWVVKSKVGSFFDTDPELWAEIKSKGHAAIIGPGHMDTLGPAVVGWCAELEKLGVPAVPLICMIFPELEKRVAYLRGMPEMRMAFIPYEVIGADEPACRNILEGNDPVNGKPVIDKMVDILTRPTTTEERNIGIIHRNEPRFLKPDTPENLEQFIKDNGLTDYLPVVLPSEEKVAEMLKGTSHQPDEFIGKMPVSGPYESLDYTVEQVAVNAVMAGVRPEHFPVVLAIASTGETSLWSSITSQTRMVVVNGPIRNEINMNSGIGALSPFNEANAVIGRSWTFLSKNLGGIGGIPKVNYLGSFGNGLNYNNLCFAENEEGLPRGWDPLHVQKGYKTDESTVSIFAGFELYSGVGPSTVSNHENIKNRLAHYFNPNNVFYRGVGFGLRALILITPEAAQELLYEGFPSKEEMAQWLATNTYTFEDNTDAKAITDNIHLDIVVVGGTAPGFELGNLHYVTTASIDKWR